MAGEGTQLPEGARLRESLGHPVIDADGHWLEYGPVVGEAMRKIGGDAAVRAMQINGARVRRSLRMTPGERRRENVAQEAFWGAPTRNTRDRATAMMPRLLYERLDEFGIDFAVLFPTMGLGLPRVNDTEARIAACRAFNVYQAELFEPLKDRITPPAVIPMHHPEEAIAELEHAVGELGLKAVMLNSMIDRPIAKVAEERPDAADLAVWYDVIGLDSDYDYDPVWEKCRELGVSPTFHRGSRGRAFRMSPSNFCYNHIGHFAAASEAVCKAIFLGGVTRRFPELNFAFLEGGVGFACLLYADLIGHWNIRNREALEDVNPANLDPELLLSLAEQYAPAAMVDAIRDRNGISTSSGARTTGGIEELDDYAACGIDTAEDFKTLFVEPFYFGCEADDSSNAWAFNRACNPNRAEIKTLFGSDIGHFDVQDMSEVLTEAYELVEDERIDTDGFRRFVFENPVHFWGKTNPAFFDGTRVANEARALLVS
ncbi:MAG: amidohydrolase family protein [Gammaproteobacteria bacterium]|nr:amidohydrolase family protein [Gammaproteobacteria bacterium]